MKLLIDTHIFLWALGSPGRLAPQRRHAIESRTNEVFLSAVSIAELMIKHSLGKLVIDFDPLAMADRTGIQVLPLAGAEALLLGRLPFHHRDPFDRMIIVQAIANGWPVMTDDLQFRNYECRTI